jgi:YHS domain-containing protein
MKKILFVMAITVFLSLMAAGSAFSKEQAVCPVMGGKINKELYADHDGKRVYFCCAMCPDPFKKDPQKYIKKMEDDGVSLLKVPSEVKSKAGHEGHNHD